MHWQLLMFFDMLIYQWDHSRLYFIGIIQSDVFPKVFNIRIRKSVQDGLSKLVDDILLDFDRYTNGYLTHQTFDPIFKVLLLHGQFHRWIAFLNRFTSYKIVDSVLIRCVALSSLNFNSLYNVMSGTIFIPESWVAKASLCFTVSPPSIAQR